MSIRTQEASSVDDVAIHLWTKHSDSINEWALFIYDQYIRTSNPHPRDIRELFESAPDILAKKQVANEVLANLIQRLVPPKFVMRPNLYALEVRRGYFRIIVDLWLQDDPHHVSIPHGRGDGTTHGGGPDARVPSPPRPKEDYNRDLRVGSGIKVSTRDFR